MSFQSHTAFVRTHLTPLSATTDTGWPSLVNESARLAAKPLARAVFVDDAGTLIEDQADEPDPARLRFMPRALDGLRLLGQAGYRLIVVSQQPGLARRSFSRAALSRVHAALTRLAKAEGVVIADVHVCPHAPVTASRVAGCLCRIPAPGLLRQAARSHGLDLARSWMVGDRLDDVEAGRRAGCRTAMLDVGSETEWRISPLRSPDLRAANLMQAAEDILACDAAHAVPHAVAPAWLPQGQAE
jgi:histidinol-phosphate phosphatase family protein